MLGIRTLLYILGIALIVWILLRRSKERTVAKKPGTKVSDMVRCAGCGTYVPRGEAIRDGDTYYCCNAHRNQDH